MDFLPRETSSSALPLCYKKKCKRKAFRFTGFYVTHYVGSIYRGSLYWDYSSLYSELLIEDIVCSAGHPKRKDKNRLIYNYSPLTLKKEHYKYPSHYYIQGISISPCEGKYTPYIMIEDFVVNPIFICKIDKMPH